jgi:2-aminoadipate transaminase
MDNLFSDRIADVPRSFIREILKVAIDPSVISFAGGLPNRNLFPVDELRAAANQVFATAGREALQYANSEGFIELREYISIRYREKQGLEIPPDNILITNGSQQGLDLLGKTFLNQGDDVIIEEPGYLGAIQAFSVYRARFNPVPLTECGMEIDSPKGFSHQGVEVDVPGA